MESDFSSNSSLSKPKPEPKLKNLTIDLSGKILSSDLIEGLKHDNFTNGSKYSAMDLNFKRASNLIALKDLFPKNQLKSLKEVTVRFSEVESIGKWELFGEDLNVVDDVSISFNASKINQEAADFLKDLLQKTRNVSKLCLKIKNVQICPTILKQILNVVSTLQRIKVLKLDISQTVQVISKDLAKTLGRLNNLKVLILNSEQSNLEHALLEDFFKAFSFSKIECLKFILNGNDLLPEKILHLMKNKIDEEMPRAKDKGKFNLKFIEIKLDNEDNNSKTIKDICDTFLVQGLCRIKYRVFTLGNNQSGNRGEPQISNEAQFAKVEKASLTSNTAPSTKDTKSSGKSQRRSQENDMIKHFERIASEINFSAEINEENPNKENIISEKGPNSAIELNEAEVNPANQTFIQFKDYYLDKGMILSSASKEDVKSLVQMISELNEKNRSHSQSSDHPLHICVQTEGLNFFTKINEDPNQVTLPNQCRESPSDMKTLKYGQK